MSTGIRQERAAREPPHDGASTAETGRQALIARRRATVVPHSPRPPTDLAALVAAGLWAPARQP